MGQKVNPIGLRLKVNKTWDSQWFGDKKDISKNILEDYKIRETLMKKYNQCSISKILIERSQSRLTVTILTGRPGMLIGVKGAGVETIKKEIAKISSSSNITVNIREVKKVDLDAAIVADSIAKQLEKRVSWRRCMKQAIQKAQKAGAEGIKVMVSGRLDGAEIARSEFYQEGNLPLHTIRADIDYGVCEALTTFGIIGVKVWIYKGEVLGKKTPVIPATTVKEEN
ncbi:MAG: 30S ribosomal protein S3 [Christensenellales bacterium]